MSARRSPAGSLEDERRLVERARRDPEAFGELYLRYVRSIYNYIFYRTGDPEEAEDLTSRVFLQALQHLPRFRERGLPFAAWLFRIAHNLVANWHRDRQRHPVFPLSENGHERSAERVEAALERQEEREQLLKAIRRLPPDRQQLLILKFVEGLSNAEIARIMGRTEGAIRVLYHRTLEALRKELTRER
ncbi:sigma-70 family RNA polymerase sigma factor [Thermoflexus sp.]|uniref:sigma-70 family RNA polymerase sigma factor n=1 Tax=Thermoflexus sp. TaxID=1969742 RepID=UPI002ADD5C6F|nr:sigma-70 family RNA polymerase sigma factor [Thermoflexus sp.]